MTASDRRKIDVGLNHIFRKTNLMRVGVRVLLFYCNKLLPSSFCTEQEIMITCDNIVLCLCVNY